MNRQFIHSMLVFSSHLQSVMDNSKSSDEHSIITISESYTKRDKAGLEYRYMGVLITNTALPPHST